MRHLFSRGFYKPMGVSGETLRKSLLLLEPEIYGSIAEKQSELEGNIITQQETIESSEKQNNIVSEKLLLLHYHTIF